MSDTKSEKQKAHWQSRALVLGKAKRFCPECHELKRCTDFKPLAKLFVLSCGQVRPYVAPEGKKS
jgi:hypothetical protein